MISLPVPFFLLLAIYLKLQKIEKLKKLGNLSYIVSHILDLAVVFTWCVLHVLLSPVVCVNIN